MGNYCTVPLTVNGNANWLPQSTSSYNTKIHSNTINIPPKTTTILPISVNAIGPTKTIYTIKWIWGWIHCIENENNWISILNTWGYKRWKPLSASSPSLSFSLFFLIPLSPSFFSRALSLVLSLFVFLSLALPLSLHLPVSLVSDFSLPLSPAPFPLSEIQQNRYIFCRPSIFLGLQQIKRPKLNGNVAHTVWSNVSVSKFPVNTIHLLHTQTHTAMESISMESMCNLVAKQNKTSDWEIVSKIYQFC